VVNLPAGSLLSSHLLAFDPPNSHSVSDITIEFSNDVLAVITADGTLADTHALFGLEGLDYPGFVTFYGFEADTENFSVSGNTVVFSGAASDPGDYFRVLTSVPAPGTAIIACVGFLASSRRRR
ncbi:MAG: hypothetical protein K8E66_02320, partial [Phycisphaerales bacterium]|nr:hypothetical protein [Phycisphaerales bacterium]